MKYALEFKLQGLPDITSNDGQGSWKSKWGNSRKWKNAVHLAVRAHGPIIKLERAKLTLTRFSSRAPDFDNLAISFKPLIDGLVQCGLLANDKLANIGQPVYLWKQAPIRKGYVTVKVEEI